jgi:hypothetical protein
MDVLRVGCDRSGKGLEGLFHLMAHGIKLPQLVPGGCVFVVFGERD